MVVKVLQGIYNARLSVFGKLVFAKEASTWIDSVHPFRCVSIENLRLL